jgi:hypothetical protein
VLNNLCDLTYFTIVITLDYCGFFNSLSIFFLLLLKPCDIVSGIVERFLNTVRIKNLKKVGINSKGSYFEGNNNDDNKGSVYFVMSSVWRLLHMT